MRGILLECILVTLESAFLFCDSPARPRLAWLEGVGERGGGQNPRVSLFCLFVFTNKKISKV